MDECAFNLCPARSVCYDNAGGFTCVWKDNRRRRSLLNGEYLFLHLTLFPKDISQIQVIFSPCLVKVFYHFIILEKLVYTIKLPFTSDGMKAMWNTDLLREKINKCTGKRKLVLCPLRLTVVTR